MKPSTPVVRALSLAPELVENWLVQTIFPSGLNLVKNDNKDKEENQRIHIKHKKIIITGKRKLIFLKINTIKNNN